MFTPYRGIYNMGPKIYEYKYSWHYPSLQDNACDPTYKSLSP